MINLIFYTFILLINLFFFKYCKNFIYHNKIKFIVLNILFVFAFIFFFGDNTFLVFESLFSYLIIMVYLVYIYFYNKKYIIHIGLFFLISTFIFNFLNLFTISYILAVPAFIMIFTIAVND